MALKRFLKHRDIKEAKHVHIITMEGAKSTGSNIKLRSFFQRDKRRKGDGFSYVDFLRSTKGTP